MLDFFPSHIKKLLKKFNVNSIYEVRLRKGSPLSINLNGVFNDLNYVVTEDDLNDSFNNCCNYSVYSFAESIRHGYVTSKNGERIGLGGQFVYEKNEILTIKNFSSLCVRIPHSIKNCAEDIASLFKDGRIKNVLIISPPGMGKTTILRNISDITSDKLNKNVVIVDEKNEICAGFDFRDYGIHTDVLSGVKKSDGINYSIKNLRPDIIITDEISNFDDYLAIYDAVYCGVKVICSVHAYDFEDFTKKRIAKLYLNNLVFDYYVVISDQIGKIKDVYSYKGEKID